MKLGEWFEFDTLAEKRRVLTVRGTIPPEKPESIHSVWGGTLPRETWSMWVRWKLANPVKGMYIGWRTVFDGKVTWEGEEIGNVFQQYRKHKVLLFVTDGRTNPIRVFPEDVLNSVN
jgi:hypothetical protein